MKRNFRSRKGGIRDPPPRNDYDQTRKSECKEETHRPRRGGLMVRGWKSVVRGREATLTVSEDRGTWFSSFARGWKGIDNLRLLSQVGSGRKPFRFSYPYREKRGKQIVPLWSMKRLLRLIAMRLLVDGEDWVHVSLKPVAIEFDCWLEAQRSSLCVR